MCNLNFLLIISSVVVQAKCVGERENGFERKRFDITLETCIENFDVHVDKIIRTQDSRAMGAKYLNEAEMNSRDECMKLCCETPTCDVFVFEQKIPGSCYLFHCGSPEDFKCKFTQHRNYTSAVLSLNNRLSELENRMKLTKHEEELNMLRKMDLSLETTTFLPLSTKVPALSTQPKHNSTKKGLERGISFRNSYQKAKEKIKSLKPKEIKKDGIFKKFSSQSSRGSQCSRYQFECRESGECIAIYNACDGIPQCSDGSDEAPESFCPFITGPPQFKTFHEQLKNLKEKDKQPFQTEKIAEIPASSEPIAKIQQPLLKAALPPRQHQMVPNMGHFPFGYSLQNEQTAESTHPKIDHSQQLSNQPRYYGREGEMVQYPAGGVQWQRYQPQAPEENNHLFNRKGNGLIPDISDSQYQAPYSNELGHSEYLKYAAAASNNGYYGGSGPVYPAPKNWPPRVPQQLHGLEDIPQRPILSMYGNGISGSAPSDYYYEDSQLRGRFPSAPQDPRAQQNTDVQQQNLPLRHPEKQEPFEEYMKPEEPKKNESVKKTLENITPSSIKTYSKSESTTAASTKEQKSERGVAESLKMTEGEVDGVNERPSGAILSLTLGMCITAIMITLVGCRLRVVRKRMRRNSKSPYAHDADFLVNGMYL